MIKEEELQQAKMGCDDGVWKIWCGLALVCSDLPTTVWIRFRNT